MSRNTFILPHTYRPGLKNTVVFFSFNLASIQLISIQGNFSDTLSKCFCAVSVCLLLQTHKHILLHTFVLMVLLYQITDILLVRLLVDGLLSVQRKTATVGIHFSVSCTWLWSFENHSRGTSKMVSKHTQCLNVVRDGSFIPSRTALCRIITLIFLLFISISAFIASGLHCSLLLDH